MSQHSAEDASAIKRQKLEDAILNDVAEGAPAQTVKKAEERSRIPPFPDEIESNVSDFVLFLCILTAGLTVGCDIDGENELRLKAILYEQCRRHKIPVMKEDINRDKYVEILNQVLEAFDKDKTTLQVFRVSVKTQIEGRKTSNLQSENRTIGGIGRWLGGLLNDLGGKLETVTVQQLAKFLVTFCSQETQDRVANWAPIFREALDDEHLLRFADGVIRHVQNVESMC